MNAHKLTRSVSPYQARIPRQPLPRYSVEIKSWKVGKYYDNSGTQNAIQKTSSDLQIASNRSSNQQIWPQHSFDGLIPRQEKKFTSNSESKQTWNPPNRCSLINYQNHDYNPITHTRVNRPESTTTGRQKGFGEFLSVGKPSKRELFRQYQKNLERDPKIFHKKNGEFSKHQDNCVKLSGLGPFSNPFLY